MIVIKPRENFLKWVKDVAQNDQLGLSLEQIYSTAGSSWIVKNPTTFESYQDFEEYIRGKKPDLIRVEVTSVYPGRGMFPKAFSAESFDDFFSFEVFDELPLIECLE